MMSQQIEVATVTVKTHSSFSRNESQSQIVELFVYLDFTRYVAILVLFVRIEI
jgi:hypothetical protein